jgi:hypothetical protein
MSPDKIMRALDFEAKAHDVFSLAVAIAEPHSEPRNDILVFHDEENRETRIQTAIDGGLIPLGLLAIIRTDHGFVCGFRRFTHEGWAIRILQSALLEMSTLVGIRFRQHDSPNQTRPDLGRYPGGTPPQARHASVLITPTSAKRTSLSILQFFRAHSYRLIRRKSKSGRVPRGASLTGLSISFNCAEVMPAAGVS